MCGSSVVRFGGGFGQSFSFGDNIDTYIYTQCLLLVKCQDFQSCVDSGKHLFVDMG